MVWNSCIVITSCIGKDIKKLLVVKSLSIFINSKKIIKLNIKYTDFYFSFTKLSWLN